MKAHLILLFLLIMYSKGFTQNSKIKVEYSDFADINQVQIPDALLLTGNVRVSHEGVVMKCNKAYYFQNENYIKAFGDVQMIQGDTLTLNSKYAEYNGVVRKAFASGEVIMNSPESTLTTDTIYFDRNSQEVYFNTYGTIVNKKNTLRSKAGRYYVKEKKYEFLSEVKLKNPDYTINSNHLDYKTTNGNSVLKGPSTIVGKESFIYTENGHYNSKLNTGYFLKKSYIKYKDRLIEADSLYYNRNIEFASGTHNVKITDSINQTIIKGHYGEVYKQKDSTFITKYASIRYKVENDSMFIHAKKIFLTGKAGERVVIGQKDVRFYKTDLSGKCDSINSSQKKSLTQLIGKPIIWNNKNQLTGDLMHLIGNNSTEKIDSLKVLNNAFIISKDTIGNGYNQVKGLYLYSKFKNNKMYETDVVKNVDVIFYIRNDNQDLIGINRSVCSRINMIMDENSEIETFTLHKNPDGDIYPEKDFPENARILRGFEWRGEEQIKTKDDIYPFDEVEMHNAIVARSKEKYEKEKQKQEIEDIKMQDKLSGDDFYEDLFKKYNNYVLMDKNGTLLIPRNFKFRFPIDTKALEDYKRKYPKYKKVIKFNTVLWDWVNMQGKKYDGGPIKGNEEPEEIELQAKEFFTYDEVFELYNDRLIFDRNGTDLLVKDGKFKFPADKNALQNFRKKNPKYKTSVRINQVLWEWNMVGGPYDGGLID